VIFATWQVGQLLWSMFWFALLFMLIWVVIAVFTDMFRSHDLSGWAKAIWTVFIVFMPWLGVFLYLLIRGGSMGGRSNLGGDTGRSTGSYAERVSVGYGAPSGYGPR
jgi:phospholipase D-like protein